MKDLLNSACEALSGCIEALARHCSFLDDPHDPTAERLALDRAQETLLGLVAAKPELGGAPAFFGADRVLLARELHSAGPGFRSVRVVLVDASTERKREYVVARHYGGDGEWSNGNYFRELAEAAVKFDHMTDSLEYSPGAPAQDSACDCEGCEPYVCSCECHDE